MKNARGLESTLDLERRVLGAICLGTPDRSVRAAAASLLGGYAWREPVHRVVFEELIGFAATSAPLLREHLPARLARRGFPDFDFQFLFEPHGLSKREAEELMRELAGAPAD